MNPRIFICVLIFALAVVCSPLGTQAATQTTGADTSQTQTTGVDTTGSQANNGSDVTLLNPLGAGTSLPVLLTDILQFFVKIGAVVVVFMLIYIGFLFVTAQGEPGKISQAKEALMWTIVGALILLGAEAIAQGIAATVQALSVGG